MFNYKPVLPLQIMNLFFGGFLNLILCIFSYFIPKNKNQIILGSFYGNGFFGNPKYFYKYLLQNKEKHHFSKIYWITKNKEIYSNLKQRNLPVVYLYSWKGFVRILRSNFIITSYNHKDISYAPYLPGNFNRIQTYHGLPFKGFIPHGKKGLIQRIRLYLFKRSRMSYMAFLTTSDFTKKIERNFFFKNILILGYPRHDIFYNKGLIDDDYKTKLRLGKYKKVILYAPTFRDKGYTKFPFHQNFLKTLNEFLHKNNFVLLILEHPLQLSKLEINSFSNIRRVTNQVKDVNDLLIHVDVLISDYSSIVMDFVLLKKPIIFYPYDMEDFIAVRNWKENYIGKKLENKELDYFNMVPGPFAKNEDEFLNVIESIDSIFNEPKYMAKFLEFRKRYHLYDDGKSCERLLNFLLKPQFCL